MISYPTLEAKPSVKFSHTAQIDTVYRSRYLSGAVFSTPLFTGYPDEYSILYDAMSNTDKLLLEAWEKDDVDYGGVNFSWYNYKTEKTYEAKLPGTIQYKRHPSGGLLWIVSHRILQYSEI